LSFHHGAHGAAFLPTEKHGVKDRGVINTELAADVGLRGPGQLLSLAAGAYTP